MKRNMLRPAFLWICLLLMHFRADSQPYQSLFSHGDFTTTWTHFAFNLSQANFATSRYEKDTVVHGVAYKKVVLMTPVTDGLFGPFSGGLFREDTMTGRVWYRDVKMSTPLSPSDTVERLAFRFDLQVGDTFDLSHSSGGFPDSLQIVDSIRVIGGLKYIYFRAQVFGEPVAFIEGIGCNLGIFWKCENHAGFFALWDTYLLCSYKNGEKTHYHNRKYDGNCQPYSHIEHLSDRTNAEPVIVLYPQPARGIIKISNGRSQPIKRIQIFTSQGRLVRSLTGDNITQLEAGDLSAGLYYIKLFSDRGYLTGRPMAID